MSEVVTPRMHKVPRGMTRQTVISGWGFPLQWLAPVIGGPVLITFFTGGNVFWLLLIIPATLLARRLGDNKDNSPRTVFLSVVSGSYFAKHEGGAEVVHPLTSCTGRGLLHD